MQIKRLIEIEEISHYSNGGFAGLSEAEADELIEAVRSLRNAAEIALPWLIRLGDFIGNGEKEQPMGRCNAVLALRNALDEPYRAEKT